MLADNGWSGRRCGPPLNRSVGLTIHVRQAWWVSRARKAAAPELGVARRRSMSQQHDMDSTLLERQLRDEGFRRVYVWQDAGGAVYDEHAHPVETAHIILEGEMTLTCAGTTRTYRAGERPPDIPAGAVHSARMGPAGCRYVIGEK